MISLQFKRNPASNDSELVFGGKASELLMLANLLLPAMKWSGAVSEAISKPELIGIIDQMKKAVQ